MSEGPGEAGAGPPGRGAGAAGRGAGAAGASRAAGGERRRGEATGEAAKKKIDKRFNRCIMAGVARGKGPSRSAAAKLCHKVWLSLTT